MSETAIDIEGLRFSWDRGALLLNIKKMTVKPGERVFLYGPSGSGKSTLLGLIAGVIAPQSGQLNILGNDLAAMTQSQRDRFRADHIGVIFQTFNLLPYLSVIENILLGCEFSNARRHKAEQHKGGAEGAASELLVQLGLSDDVRDRPVTALSIGQQQRVAVARALIGGPDIVIADEPTSALDTASRLRFLDLLNAACDASGTTLLFVSHDMTLAAQFDRQVELNELNKKTAQFAEQGMSR